MKKGFAISLAIVGVVAAVAVIGLNSIPNQTLNLVQQDNGFASFVSRHGKSYATKEEYELRMQNYLKSLEIVTHHNTHGDPSYTLGLNHFADWTDEEYKRLLGYKAHHHHNESTALHFDPSTVESNGPIDWRGRGVVHGVQNQGNCGSCWAFSAASALESHFAIQHGQLHKLSEQELVDCSGAYGNQGCNGGWYDAAFQFGRDYGMMQAGSYPYVGYQQGCSYNAQAVVVKTSTYYQVGKDPNALKSALNQGPVSVAVEAGNDAFRYYKGGIVTGGCGTRLDHAIVAVGWGSEGGRDYFIVRNSWGSGWGEGGYIRLAATGGAGVCGILSGPPSYPVTN